MFRPTVRFLVCSDVHYRDEVTPSRELFEKFVNMGYELAEQSETYKGLDALYICGDFTDTGTEKQFRAFRDSLDRTVRPGTRIVPLLGGHEFFHAGGDDDGVVERLCRVLEPEFAEVIKGPAFAVERLRDILGCEEDTHYVINGFHFITLSSTRVNTQWYDTYTREKMNWLMAQLKEATRDTPNRPVFLFQHTHICGTVYGKEGWSKPELCLPLVGFPQVVDFSGHSHAPCTDPRTVHQCDYTSVGTGALYCVEYNDTNVSQGWSAEEGKNCAQALLVEANEAGDVLIKVLDVVEGVVREERLIERPWDPDSFTYTDARMLTETAPEFAADAEVKVTAAEGVVRVEFPQAVGGVAQYIVNIRRAEDRSVADRAVSWSKQIYYHPPRRLTVTFDHVEPGNYLAEVRPKGYFGSLGAAVSAEFCL